MEVEPWFSIVLFIFLLVLSAFFSGSESAYFSLSHIDLNRMREEKDKSGSTRRILKLLERPRQLLTSILIGNTIVNVAAAIVAALFALKFIFGDSSGGVLLEIIIVTLIILIFSEVSPKVFAVKQSLRFAHLVSLPLIVIVKIFYPLSFILEKITQSVSFLLNVRKEIPFVSEEEIRTLIEVGEEKGALDKSEREMIHSIFEFRETMVKEVMVPRIDMVCVEKSTQIEDVLKIVKERGHSRIPVYDEKVDNVMGILFVKDLLPYMRGEEKVPRLSDLVRKVYFVPESKMIYELLREFQKERTHMAIVVDEYGGTAGLVTLEDVIEEIVGEIRDEYDKEKPLIQQVDNDVWLIEGKTNIEDINNALGLSLPTEEDYESLGGFIFSLLGSVPGEKEEIRYQGLLLIIEKVQRQRIRIVRVIKESREGEEQKEGN